MFLCSSKYFMSLCHVPVLFLHILTYESKKDLQCLSRKAMCSVVEKLSLLIDLQKTDLKLPQIFAVSQAQTSLRPPRCFLYLLCICF